jgi:hypothetical protein
MADEFIAIVAIVVVIGIPLMIPIIAMLLKHQRTMAELIHQKGQSDANVLKEIESLRAEVNALRTELEYSRLAESSQVRESSNLQ